MKSKPALGAQAFAMCLLLGALPAEASTISIGLAKATGSAITTEASGSGAAGVAWAGSYDKYIFNVIMASDPNPIDLTSGTINVKGPNATAPIYLYVTETGLTSSAASLNFSSEFGIASLPTGWSLTEATYLDNSDAEYGLGTLLDSTSASGPTVNSSQTPTKTETVASTFSLTEVYEIFSDATSGIVGASETIKAAPAPAIGNGIPGLLAVGAVLLGWKLWERRRQA